MPENVVEARSETIELIAGHIGGDQAHAAPDICPGTAGNDEAVGIDHGADRNARTFVKIGCENATANFRFDVAEVADTVQRRYRVGNFRQCADLNEAGAIYRNRFVGEKLNVDTRRRV